MRFVDAELTLSWHVVSTLELTAKAHQSEPDLYLAMNSIFTVFANTERTGVGGGVFWQAQLEQPVLLDASLFGNACAGGDRVLLDIEACTARVKHFHVAPPEVPARAHAAEI